MQLRKALYFVLVVAFVGLACGLNLLSEVDMPFTSTSTFTPLPTRTPTITPTYPPKIETSNEQYRVEVQENSTTTFTDRALGYRLEFSPEWLVIPITEETQNELYDVIGEELNPTLQALLDQTRQQAGIRVVALDYILRYSPDENSISNLTVIYQEDLASAAYDLDILLEANAMLVPTQVPDAAVTYQAIQTNPNGIEYAKLVVSHPASTFGVPLRQMAMMVKMDEGLLVITGSVQEDIYARVEPIFQKIFDSLEKIN